MEPSRLMRLAPSREGCLLPLGWASGVQLQFLPARSPEDFSDPFTTIKREGAQAPVILADPMFSLNAEPLARLALENQLPTVGAKQKVRRGRQSYRIWARLFCVVEACRCLR